MTNFKHFLGTFILTFLLTTAQSKAQDLQYERGREAIQKMTGCYLIDYSYTETEGLQSGYLRDPRDEVLAGDRPFVERTIPREPPRFVKISEIENLNLSKNMNDPETRKAAKTSILNVITSYRVTEQN